jgi:two-component sensor histidine kinase
VYQPIVEANGEVSGIFVQGQDVTDHVAAENRLSLINGELRHRVRNTLAMVGAVVHQTFRDPVHRPLLSVFEARLSAFGAADQAISGAQGGADVGEVVRLALKPHIPAPNRYVIEGPSVAIGSKQAVSLALTMHEMATNAAKYGAMSTRTGRVLIRWSLTDGPDGQFRFEWREEGGPPVAPPKHTGFGSRLVKSVMAADFEGKVDVTYDPAGVVLTLVSPASALGDAEIAAPEGAAAQTAGT